jgi:hypothetical protein
VWWGGRCGTRDEVIRGGGHAPSEQVLSDRPGTARRWRVLLQIHQLFLYTLGGRHREPEVDEGGVQSEALKVTTDESLGGASVRLVGQTHS